MEPEAVTAIAQIALDRKVGARGLRGITEEVLKDLMYEVPSDPDIRRVVITQESVHKIKDPIVFHKREFQVR
jgi:ATP-dependent Clp protease ATP-binding subunit ClpX